jgi:hypothetical protein
MGDEFALLDLEDGRVHPFPRAISLKNQAIGVMEEIVGPERLGPWLRNTPKGTIRHLRPNADAIARMDEPARPAMILFPGFGRDLERAVRPVGEAEVFVRLTQASTNYVTLGERGFSALAGLVQVCRPVRSTIRTRQARWRGRRALARPVKDARLLVQALREPPRSPVCKSGLDGADRGRARGVACGEPRLSPRRYRAAGPSGADPGGCAQRR